MFKWCIQYRLKKYNNLGVISLSTLCLLLWRRWRSDQIWWPIYAEIQVIPKGSHTFSCHCIRRTDYGAKAEECNRSNGMRSRDPSNTPVCESQSPKGHLRILLIQSPFSHACTLRHYYGNLTTYRLCSLYVVQIKHTILLIKAPCSNLQPNLNNISDVHLDCMNPMNSFRTRIPD